jgi:DNA polymerase (family X)
VTDGVTDAATLAVAEGLAEIAALLGLRRGERFRSRAFRTAARTVAALPLPVSALTAEERRRLDGVGASVDRAIGELLEGGTSSYLERLRADEPAGVGRLVQVVGIAPRTARALSAAGITDLDRLAAAVDDGTLGRFVKERTAEVVADGLRRVDLVAAGRPVLRQARLESEAWARAMAALPGVARADAAGDARRGVAQPAALAVRVVHDDGTAPADVVADLLTLPRVVRGLDGAAGAGASRTAGGPGPVVVLVSSGRRLDVHLAAPAAAGTALVVATGSAAHVAAVRERGLATAADEAAAYRTAGLDAPPPPLREAAPPDVPGRLLRQADVRGDGHVHTDWSGDGHDPIDALAAAAAARGYDWIALTDHAVDLTMNGLTREALLHRDHAIEAARERHLDVVLLKGLELNIGVDGGLDYDLETLLGQDWCVASIHSLFQRPSAVQTERILAAVAHPAVDAIGHPTGRLLGVRPGYEVDVHAIAQACAETGTALEVNGSPRRLDLDAGWVAVAVAAGAPLLLSSDAHRVAELDHMAEAVLTAQRGGAPVELVRNAGDPPRRTAG